jgi:nitrate reductase beta subunit
MFGPGVDEAIERYAAPSRELLAVMQLFRAQQKIIFRYEIKEGPKIFERTINGKKWEMYNDTVIGFDKNGKEVVSLTVQEPLHVRPDKHQNSI